VICDVKCSELVMEMIPSLGGKIEMIRTGHTYFIEEIMSGNAVLGAEFSGHVYFGDRYYGFDDGLYAACRVLEIMDESGLKASELMKGLPSRVSSPELKLECEDKEKFNVVELIKADVGSDKSYRDLNFTDGVRAKISKTGWF